MTLAAFERLFLFPAKKYFYIRKFAVAKTDENAVTFVTLGEDLL